MSAVSARVFRLKPPQQTPQNMDMKQQHVQPFGADRVLVDGRERRDLERRKRHGQELRANRVDERVDQQAERAHAARTRARTAVGGRRPHSASVRT